MSAAQEIIAQASPAPEAKVDAPPGVEAALEGGAATPKDDAISPKLAVIARKEREFFQKQQEFQKQMEEWKRERETLKREADEYRSKRTLWKDDPEKFLEEMGWDYDRLTERKLNGGGVTPKDLEKKMEERFKTMEERIAEEKAAIEKARKEKEEKEAQEIVDSFKTSLKGFVEKSKEKYKLTNLFDKNAELLFDTIDAYYKEHGKVLANEEAADLVEKYFVKLYEDAKTALTPAEQRALDDEKKGLGVSDKKPSSTTLTNSMSATGTSGFVSAKTDADRMKRALAALGGNQ